MNKNCAECKRIIPEGEDCNVIIDFRPDVNGVPHYNSLEEAVKGYVCNRCYLEEVES